MPPAANKRSIPVMSRSKLKTTKPRPRLKGEQKFFKPVFDEHGEVAKIDLSISLDQKMAIKAPTTFMVAREIVGIVSRRLGYYNGETTSRIFSLKTLAAHVDEIRDFLEDVEVAGRDELMGLIEGFCERRIARIQENTADGVVEFDDLVEVFPKGKEVAFAFDNKECAGVVKDLEYHTTFFGQYAEVTIGIIRHGVHGPEADTVDVPIGGYDGLRSISSLPFKVLDEPTKARLTERGRMFRKIASERSYLRHDGQITRRSYWSTNSSYSRGRAMVDAGMFAVMDNDQLSQELNRYTNSGRDNRSESTAIEIPDDMLWSCAPFVYGFSMSAKKWGRMCVEDLSDIRWRADAFDRLVLPDEKKRLVRALIEHSEGAFKDIVDDKGGGVIFLMHGPPGQGKTATAETVAETLRRPLYSVTVGELGTDPDVLEERLRHILDLAEAWKAILLLDEADIFLEARDERDIVRNAMVGVFLRLLEYHQGVLFLTTNRVKNIDKAFLSRISVTMRYESADHAKRLQIWKNLLDAAGVRIAEHEIEDLASRSLNGRQIKNAIRLGQILAKAQGTDPGSNASVYVKAIEDSGMTENLITDR